MGLRCRAYWDPRKIKAQLRDLRRLELLRHLQHHMIAIIPPFRDLPVLQLLNQVERWLRVQRWSVHRAETFGTMALHACIDVQLWRRRSQKSLISRWQSLRRQSSVETGYPNSFIAVKKARHVTHQFVWPKAGRIVFHLLLQIARRQASQTRRVETIALTACTVTSDAGVARAAFTTTHCNEFTTSAPLVITAAHAICASRGQYCHDQSQRLAETARKPVSGKRWLSAHGN